MKRFLSAMAASVAILGSAAHAANPRLFVPVTFDAGSDVPDAVRNECGVDYKLQEEAARQLKGHDKAWEPTETLDGSVIRLTILTVKAGAAGAMSGAKSLSARVELIENGKVQHTTVMHASAYSVPLLTFKSTCTILDKATRGLAKRVAQWARNPDKTFKDDDEVAGEPAAAVSPASQASSADR